jgi:hypothetical protein
MGAASEAFDQLSKEERLTLLEMLGFDEPQRYQIRESINLTYGCMYYEVQEELDRCFIRGVWRRPVELVFGKNTLKRSKRSIPRRRKKVA